MNRIDRVSAILIKLQSKKVVKGQEIADGFSILLIRAFDIEVQLILGKTYPHSIFAVKTRYLNPEIVDSFDFDIKTLKTLTKI
jgi:hypothetical protein